MKKLLLSLIPMATLVACASNTPPHLNPTTQIIRMPDPVVVVNKNAANDSFKLAYGNDPALQAAFMKYSKTGKAPNIITAGFIRFAYSSQHQPIINCQPFLETIITLEPGEKFTSITSGDPTNLSYTVAVSGSGGVETQHVLVKPGAEKLSTNLVIVTNKRVYNLLILVGKTAGHVTRSVSFWYPEQMIASVNSKIDKQNDINLHAEEMPQLNLAHSNFNYTLDYSSWNKPSWYPVRVFDDGKRTWIEFPKGTDDRGLPSLLIETDSGQDLKINQSYYSPYMVLDGVFDRAKLISGVVTIARRLLKPK